MDEPTPKLPSRPFWLGRVETLGTTLVVLLIAAMVLWLDAAEQAPRVAFAIGAGVLSYVIVLVAVALRSGVDRIDWWPFALAGTAAGAIAELINAEFLVSRESAAAAVTGALIGTAQWIALRTWLRLTGQRT